MEPHFMFNVIDWIIYILSFTVVVNNAWEKNF